MAKVFIKLNWATANAFLPSESRPAIEKNIGAIAELPSPAIRKPKNAIINAKFLFKSTIAVEMIKADANPRPPTSPPVLIQNCSL